MPLITPVRSEPTLERCVKCEQGTVFGCITCARVTCLHCACPVCDENGQVTKDADARNAGTTTADKRNVVGSESEMNTRPLIITSDQLSRIANLPIDAEIKSGGVTGSREFDGIFARISSKEFKPEDCDKPIELASE